ncbi:hypothetical protein DPMN_115352 [Dreissena polymorpha]|uniref:Uncharacterized protein n=1 Tax=Dreissena polymorpha TaxID=45954 RepID=A0A9D4KMN1_DREPO|nr:hypothetical protein DPMN_115352 [Dreissena polymorpha]
MDSYTRSSGVEMSKTICSMVKFTVKDVFGYPAVIHPMTMAQQSETTLTEKSGRAGDVCPLRHTVMSHAAVTEHMDGA